MSAGTPSGEPQVSTESREALRRRGPMGRGRESSRKSTWEYVSLPERSSYDIAAVLNLRLAGATVVNGRPTLRHARGIILGLVFLTPSAIAIVFQIFAPGPRILIWAYIGWHIYFAAVSALAVMLSWIGCQLFYHLAPDLQTVLTEDGVRAYNAWANRRTRTRPQAWWSFTFAILAVGALAVAIRVPGMSGRLYVTPLSYLSVFMTAFFAAGGIY